jgi:hypothetical protein
MKYRLRSLMIVVLLSGPAIWFAWTLFGEYREAQAAAQMAEMRWQELQYAQSVSLKTPTDQNMLDELDARLKYEKERQRAAEKAKWCIVPVSLPPIP